MVSRGVPGAPPPPPGSRSYDDAPGTSGADPTAGGAELKVLQMLTKAEEPVQMSDLFYRSGLPSHQFRAVVDALAGRGIVKLTEPGLVALTGK